MWRCECGRVKASILSIVLVWFLQLRACALGALRTVCHLRTSRSEQSRSSIAFRLLLVTYAAAWLEVVATRRSVVRHRIRVVPLETERRTAVDTPCPVELGRIT